MVLKGWLSGNTASTKDFLDPADEVAALKDATKQAALAMNDGDDQSHSNIVERADGITEVVRAENELSKSSSPFHQLGYGATLFWQAALGFDRNMMTRASTVILQAEIVATSHLKRATKDPSTAHRSKIYPPGAEYALCQAQCQLIGAILGILSESWTESLIGVNKLRKAYSTLQGLVAAERKYHISNPIAIPEYQPDDNDEDDEDDDDVFEDAAEQQDDPDLFDTVDQRSSLKSSLRSVALSHWSRKDVIDLRAVTSNEIDLWVYSGVAMSWGITNLILSVVPPVFRHLLAMFNFRGDRQYGVALLWSATGYKHNIFGAIAGLTTSLYYNIAIGLTDITAKDAYPEEKLRTLIRGLRELYPDSQLWRMEESRMTVIHKNLEQAVRNLDFEPTQPFAQLSGVRVFERALDLMFLHRFEECAQAFIETIKLNVWSHGMYYYIAAACHIELYRDCKLSNNSEQARMHAKTAKKYLDPVSVLVKKKALMGRQLPFDAFIGTKLAKWEARAKAHACDILDCVGVSPVEEMAYFWTGYRRMSAQHLENSLARLSSCESLPTWKDETADEKAGLALLQGVALRFLGRTDEAKRKLQQEVFCYSAKQIKDCPHPVTYPLPVAHYEFACCLWKEAGEESASRDNLCRVSDEIEICDKWERYELEERMLAKLAVAKATLARLLEQ